MVLPDLIHNCQSIFSGNKNILETVLIASEVVEDAKANKKSSLI